MHKLITIAIVALFGLSLSACGANPTTAEKARNASTTTNASVKPMTDDEIAGTIMDNIGVDPVIELCNSSMDEAYSNNSWQRPFDEFTKGFDSTNKDQRVNGARVWYVIMTAGCSAMDRYSAEDIANATNGLS